MKHSKSSSVILLILLVGFFIGFTSKVYPQGARSRTYGMLYDGGYASGMSAGLVWRGEGLAYSEERIEFLKTQIPRKAGIDLNSFGVFASTAWENGYSDGWKDGYYITTDNYDNIWRPLK